MLMFPRETKVTYPETLDDVIHRLPIQNVSPLVLEATGGYKWQSEVLVWSGVSLVRDPFTEVSILFTPI